MIAVMRLNFFGIDRVSLAVERAPGRLIVAPSSGVEASMESELGR
jgi:hypothetical protein